MAVIVFIKSRLRERFVHVKILIDPDERGFTPRVMQGGGLGATEILNMGKRRTPLGIAAKFRIYPFNTLDWLETRRLMLPVTCIA